ncbi:MAG: LCP family protein [Propionibacteriaceae bacterium]
METSQQRSTAHRRSAVLARRRAIALVLMNTVLPGSAHMATGKRRIGRIALVGWLVTGLIFASLLGMFFIARDALLSFLAQGWVLYSLAALVVIGGLLWVLSIAGAISMGWRMPMTRAGRVFSSTIGGLCLILALALTVLAGHTLRAGAKLSDTVFAGGGDTELIEGRWNILLLGADDGSDREGARFDSINVVSVDAATGKAVMIGIPRNLEGAPFPRTSPMYKKYPQGFFCPDHSCLVNAINTVVENDYANLYPTKDHPGIQATKEAVEGVTGIHINYSVIIDLAGFSKLIDSVDGVHIALDKQVPISWSRFEEVTYAIPAGLDIKLNGEDALRFVRARSDSNDYVRMARQRCIMSAMLKQLDPMVVLSKFSDIAAAGEGMVSTDIPAKEAVTLGKVALKVRNTPYETLSLTPPFIYPGSPDFDEIHRVVAEKIKGVTVSNTPSVAPSLASATTSPVSVGAEDSQAVEPSTQVSPTTAASAEVDPIEIAENCRPA